MRKIIYLGTIGFFLWGHASFAEPSADEYNFNWLDPDKKVYVLQNRKYEKNDSVRLSGLFGVGTSNSYRTVLNYEFRLAYYFKDVLGLEFFFSGSKNSKNGTFEALEASSPTSLPVVREVRNQVGLLLQWSPWYAKINVFNEVLYFDWYFSLGAGALLMKLDQNVTVGSPSVFVSQNKGAVFIGTGHQYHLSNGFVVRLDFSGAFYRAPKFGNTGDNAWFSNYNFNVGVGYQI